ncbi:MAG: amino acid permease [Deltaproteobacteria bacterium]|nr:amino acid permease [Deltaproteobacteria bacterium]
MAEPRRRLSLFDCIAIGINGIIGSGIFLLPGWVALGAKSLSPLAFVACGALCTLVALCYAEVGGMFERSGGTYLYAREAFGNEVGFGVGWLVLVSCILGYAAIARGFGDQARDLLHLAPWTASLIAPALVLLLGLANWRGVKSGARTSDVLTVVKVVALLLFVLGGVFFIRGEQLTSLGTPDLKGFGEGMVSALFALSGFEFVAVVAGQTDNPRRNIPLSIVGSLVGAVVLYSLIQLVVIGVLPQVAVPQTPANAAPMAAAASVFGDGPAALAVRVAALISMMGFCSGSALVGPQLFASLAQDGVVPKLVARLHPRHGTPNVAIAVVTVLAAGAAALVDFNELAEMTIITLFAQYVPTCLAVIVFRRWRPDAKRLFRVPLGALIPLAALAVMSMLITRIKTD